VGDSGHSITIRTIEFRVTPADIHLADIHGDHDPLLASSIKLQEFEELKSLSRVPTSSK